MAQGVFAITEQRDGELRKVSFEVVSEGRRVADGLGAELTAVVLGSTALPKSSKNTVRTRFWLLMTPVWRIIPQMLTAMYWLI